MQSHLSMARDWRGWHKVSLPATHTLMIYPSLLSLLIHSLTHSLTHLRSRLLGGGWSPRHPSASIGFLNKTSRFVLVVPCLCDQCPGCTLCVVYNPVYTAKWTLHQRINTQTQYCGFNVLGVCLCVLTLIIEIIIKYIYLD